MTITFIDAGILIYAARGQGKIAEKSLEILEDSGREFAASIFLKLEILPKVFKLPLSIRVRNNSINPHFSLVTGNW